MTASDTDIKTENFDPYHLDPRDVKEPPTEFGAIMKKIGPGIVLSASIVGSGELIATTTLGAELGYTVMWLIIFSCLIKALVQSFMGRYTISKGEPSLEAFNRIPGKIGKVNWVLWSWIAMVFTTLFQISAMFIGVSQVMHLITNIAVMWWVIAFFVLTLILLLGLLALYHFFLSSAPGASKHNMRPERRSTSLTPRGFVARKIFRRSCISKKRRLPSLSAMPA